VRDPSVQVRIPGSGSVPKRYGSATLVKGISAICYVTKKNVCAVAEDAHEKLAVADAKLGNAIQVSCISKRNLTGSEPVFKLIRWKIPVVTT
jgi:hypothetical protein